MKKKVSYNDWHSIYPYQKDRMDIIKKTIEAIADWTEHQPEGIVDALDIRNIPIEKLRFEIKIPKDLEKYNFLSKKNT